MKAEELRVGNLIVDYSQATPMIGRVTIEDIEHLIKFGDIVPIGGLRLTKDLLIKSGFVVDDVCVTDTHPFVDYVKDVVYISMPYFEFTFNDGDNSVQLEYYHELQNLFYQLTKQELELEGYQLQRKVEFTAGEIGKILDISSGVFNEKKKP